MVQCISCGSLPVPACPALPRSKFMSCALDDHPLPVPVSQRVCTAWLRPRRVNATWECDVPRLYYGHPGGMICRHCPTLADCPGGAKRPDDLTACKPGNGSNALWKWKWVPRVGAKPPAAPAKGAVLSGDA